MLFTIFLRRFIKGSNLKEKCSKKNVCSRGFINNFYLTDRLLITCMKLICLCLLLTESIHYSLLFWYLDVQPKSIACLVYWVTSIDKNYHCLNRGQCLITKENIFSVSNRLAVCRRIAIGQCPDTP